MKKNTAFRRFNSWEKAKSKVFCKISSSNGKNFKDENIVSKDFLDLTLNVSIYAGLKNLEILDVTKGILSEWKINEEELWKEAFENTSDLLGCKILDMHKYVENLNQPEKLIDCEVKKRGDGSLIIDEDAPFNMLILTSNESLYGAVFIVFKKILLNIANSMKSDIFIIPSSVHEVIIIPKKDFDDEKINKIIRDVNESVVNEDERLSDHVYRFELKEGKLTF